MTSSHENTEKFSPTPRDEDWEAEFDPTYDEKTSEGGAWYGKTDEEIVLIQIEEFNWDEHEQHHRRLDKPEGEED